MTVSVTAGGVCSNGTGIAADSAAGWPEKVPAILLPPKRKDCCLRRRLQWTFAPRRDLNRPHRPPYPTSLAFSQDCRRRRIIQRRGRTSGAVFGRLRSSLSAKVHCNRRRRQQSLSSLRRQEECRNFFRPASSAICGDACSIRVNDAGRHAHRKQSSGISR